MNTYVFIRKNALKTAKMSGERAKSRHFPYIKQNSIVEIVSTIESFLEKGYEVSEMISPMPQIQFFFAKDPAGVTIQFM